jgi:hypothetical protein
MLLLATTSLHAQQSGNIESNSCHMNHQLNKCHCDIKIISPSITMLQRSCSLMKMMVVVVVVVVI